MHTSSAVLLFAEASSGALFPDQGSRTGSFAGIIEESTAFDSLLVIT